MLLQDISVFQASANHGGYTRDFDDKEGSTSLVFSVQEEVGALAKALRIFEVSRSIITIINRV